MLLSRTLIPRNATPCRAGRVVDLLQLGDLGAARSAPLPPHVDHHDLAREVVERDRLAGSIRSGPGQRSRVGRGARAGRRRCRSCRRGRRTRTCRPGPRRRARWSIRRGATIAAHVTSATSRHPRCTDSSLPGQLRISPADERRRGSRTTSPRPGCTSGWSGSGAAAWSGHRAAQRLDRQLVADAHRLVAGGLDPGAVQRPRHPRGDLQVRLTPRRGERVAQLPPVARIAQRAVAGRDPFSPSKDFADSISSSSVSTGKPWWAAIGAAVSCARSSGEATT